MLDKTQRIAQIFPTPDLRPPEQFAGLGTFSWQTIVTAGINVILVLAAVIFFFVFILAGVSWISSGGDKGKIEVARQRITSALIGLTIVFAIFALIYIINELFGVNIGGLGTAPAPTPGFGID